MSQCARPEWCSGKGFRLPAATLAFRSPVLLFSTFVAKLSVSAPASAPPSRNFRLLAAVIFAFVVPLLFAAYTGEAWEDYYITLRSSRNLAKGHGLVYQIGERVHTFTSPLGVLVPALGFKLTGGDVGALWFLRGLGALALAATASLIVRHAREQAWSQSALWFALGLGLFEAKVVACSVNGMETAFLALFAVIAWTELVRSAGPRWRWLAAAYAGLMWTRPDACVLAAAMTLAAALFRPREIPTARVWWRGILMAMFAGGLLYAPWFAWAWQYYGSPVPQTIIAKSIYTPGFSLPRILLAPFTCLVSNTALDDIFMPIYAHRGWPDGLLLVGRVLARAAAFLWVVPVLPRACRAASFALLLGGVYLQQIMPYPWYFAPWTLLGALALAGAAAAAGARLPRPFVRTGAVMLAAVAGCLALTTVAQAYASRLQQTLIEDNGRKQIGLWLRDHATPGDTVFLEPIGYIGYFSQLKILDFPGLSAPEVSRIVRGGGRGGYARLIDELQPTWLVLRPWEVHQQNLEASGKLAGYDAVGFWTQREHVDAIAFLPGRPWVEFDAEFVVYHRRSVSSTEGKAPSREN